MPTVLVIMTFCAALYLLMNKSDRMWPTLAVIASGVQLLMVFGLMSLTLAKFRIDVIIPAIFVITGGMCWARSNAKGSTTAATVLFAVGAMMVLGALRLIG